MPFRLSKIISAVVILLYFLTNCKKKNDSEIPAPSISKELTPYIVKYPSYFPNLSIPNNNPLTLDITAKTVEKNNAENFLSFLKTLYRKYPNKHLHVILDNLSVHKHASVKEWVDSKKRITLHFTPTYSSWLNQIEIWFNILTKDVLKGGVWKSKKHLIDQLMEYVKTYNDERAKPFSWTYTGKPLTI